MGVIVNMIFAVAIVPLAFGAITKFQIGIGYIRLAANGAFVTICGHIHNLLVLMGGFLMTLMILCSAVLGAGGILVTTEMEVHIPAANTISARQYVQHIPSEEEHIVDDGEQGRKITQNDVVNCQHHIRPGEIFHLDRDDIHQQHPIIREHGCQCKKQAEVQIIAAGDGAKDQSTDIHKDDTGKVEQIEFKSTPNRFHHTSDAVIAHKQKYQPNTTVLRQDDVGKEPPDLPFKDQPTVKI